jgi:hypothetical protein
VPISLKLSSSLATKDGSHPPAVQEFDALFDKNGTLNTAGLPVCRRGRLEARTTSEALSACQGSLVGRGNAEAEVQFPESLPFTAKGPLLVFYGGSKGKTTMLFVHVYADVPAPTAFITPVKVTKIHDGRYGNRVTGRIPIIAGGAGSTTRFSVTNKKYLTYYGHKRSYLLARCPTGRFYAKGALSFSDGTRLKGSVVQPCTPKG